MSNDFYIERMCTERKPAAESSQEFVYGNKSLADYRTKDAYVLLGEPGAGKTKSFEYEAMQANCEYIKARELIAFDIQENWESKTLYIDGLDEVRIGSTNGLIPLDAIRDKLLKLGKPKFRLSCREADWLGASDSHDLQLVTCGGDISVIHLDEFNEKNIKEFIEHENSAIDFNKFIDWSYKHGLTALLGNPQTLKLIIKAITEEKWPDNKTEIYKIACENMLLENNVSHCQYSEAKKNSQKQLLKAAGKLFAHQLISGLEGYALAPADDSKHNPYYGSIFKYDIDLLEQALKTSLFKQGIKNGLREPVHRSVAEYLAANYLSNLIKNKGLPVRRLLSLITTADGGVVSSLRGLFAWFLTLCSEQRSLLLNRDPLGLVLYGDATAFSKKQKKDLFLYLYNEAEKHPGFRSENWLSSPFGALATEDMEDEIRKFLETPQRDAASQALVDCVIDAVEHGAILPGLKSVILNMVKDHTWWSGIRQAALRVFINMSLNENEELVLQVLDKIQKETIEDREDQLLGTFLDRLYPSVIKAGKIFDYHHRPKKNNLLGSYHKFWTRSLLEHSGDEDIFILLDQLSQRKGIKELIHGNYSMYGFIGELLAEGVEKSGDSIDIERLYDWLGIGLDKYESSILEPVRRRNKTLSIQQWISDRPEVYKALLEEGVGRCINGKRAWRHFHDITARLYSAKMPDDIGFWYLEQAGKIGLNEIAEEYFCQAVYQINDETNNKKFTLDVIFLWVDKHPEFDVVLQKILIVEGKDYQRILENAQKKQTREAGQARKKSDYLNYFIKHKNEINNGSASPAIFYDLAFAYYGYLIEANGETPHERISFLLDGSDELIASALSGLKKVIFRKDLPSVEGIIKASSVGKAYNIGHAVLAGLEDRLLSNSLDWEKITDNQYRQAIAFYFVNNVNTTPDWFKQLLHFRPDLIGEVFIQYVGASARSGKEHISGLYQLASDDSWSDIAKECVLKLLNKYPVRTSNSQIFNIQYILKAAIRYADQSALIKIIDKKLNYSSMNMRQRSRWLATGIILAPDKYTKDIIEFAEKGSVQACEIAGFLTSRDESWEPENRLPVKILALLIQNLGVYFKPYSFSRSGKVTSDMNAADMVSTFIRQLARADNIDTKEEFEKLIQLKELDKWHDLLKGEFYEYKKRLRDASFIQPDIESVVKTLSNNEPSNAADLMAITLDHLNTLATKIRDIDTNDYRQYWNTGRYDRLDTPKVEDACRDALLSDLRIPLDKLSILAEKEGYFVEDKRADIKILYSGANRMVIPVEIKRDFHKDVWKALWPQLIEKYTRDPGAQGYGIYVVFWFGTGKTPPPPSGKKPSTANEMRSALLDMMSEEEKRLIGLCVIDCSVKNAANKKS